MSQTHVRRSSNASHGVTDLLHTGTRSVMDAGTHMYEAALDKTKSTGKSIDKFVHRNPWKSVAIGAGVGLMLGLIFGRRSR